MFSTDTTRSLELLASILESEGCDVPDLVVCGGSALQIIGLLDRATKDVDVIALLHIDAMATKFWKHQTRFQVRL